MKPAGNPWMKFYPSDWRADPALRSCTIAARGLWVEMLCIMHEAVPYGSLLIAGARVDKKRLAVLAGISERECTVLLLELEGFGVFSREDDGTIYSRRMRRDAAKAVKDQENGKKGGNPSVKAGVNPPVNGEVKAQKPEAFLPERKKDAEAKASGADAPRDVRAELFGRGLAIVAQLTGKGPDACRSFVGKCLKVANDDASVVLGLVEDAERNRVVDAPAWISARLKARPAVAGASIPTADEWRSYLDSFKRFGKWKPGIGNDPGSANCRAPPELLREYGFAPVNA